MAVVSLFGTAATTLANDNQAAEQGINLGTVFKANVAGSITHLRFYETSIAAGTVTLRLYSSAGAVLASTTFTAVNGNSGWRDVALATPYAVTVGTWYMVAYQVPIRSTQNNTYVTVTPNLSAARSSSGGELTTAVDGAVNFSGNTGNGRYGYGALALPASTWQSENYGADVLFDTSGGGGTTVTGAASMTAPSVLTADGATSSVVSGAVSMGVPSALLAGGTRTQPAAAVMATPSALSVAGARTATVAAAMTAPSVLSVTAVLTKLAAVSMTAPSVLGATSGTVANAAAALTAPSVLGMTAVRSAGVAASMTAPSVMSLAAVRTKLGIVALVTPSSLSAAAVRTKLAIVAMTAPSVFSATLAAAVSPFRQWNGTSEVPLTVFIWNGTALQPVTFDSIR